MNQKMKHKEKKRKKYFCFVCGLLSFKEKILITIKKERKKKDVNE